MNTSSSKVLLILSKSAFRYTYRGADRSHTAVRAAIRLISHIPKQKSTNSEWTLSSISPFLAESPEAPAPTLLSVPPLQRQTAKPLRTLQASACEQRLRQAQAPLALTAQKQSRGQSAFSERTAHPAAGTAAA